MCYILVMNLYRFSVYSQSQQRKTHVQQLWIQRKELLKQRRRMLKLQTQLQEQEEELVSKEKQLHDQQTVMKLFLKLIDKQHELILNQEDIIQRFEPR